MSREVLDSRSSYDELYDDRPNRDRPPRAPRQLRIPAAWTAKLRTAAPVLMAFVIGAVVGGAGWNEWAAQRDSAAARSAVSFTAQMASAGPNASGSGIQAFVRLTNTGSETILIDEVEMRGAAVQSSSRRGTEPIEAKPDDDVTMRLSVEVDCSVRTASEATVSVRVRTADGVARAAELPIDDDNGHLRHTTSTVCPDPNDAFIPVSVEYYGMSSVVDDGGRALRVPVTVGVWTPVDVVLLTMRPVSNRLSVSVEGLPLQISRGSEASLPLLTTTWRVLDCRDADALRFEALGVVIEAQRPGGNVITTRVQSEPNLALELAKFIGDTCRDGT
jgi:hypothetical protein